MTEPNEFTIADYLNRFAPDSRPAGGNIGVRMCELLMGPLGDTNCEGGWEAVQQMCDVDTSITYTKSQLDWAYQQLADSARKSA